MSETVGIITKLTNQTIKIDGIAYRWRITLSKNVQKSFSIGDKVKVELKDDGTVKNVVGQKDYEEQDT